ncbi:MAG: ABC transporter permease [Proteobacteria bacterium]|nr:ABC transporter permease [Pseudomonadota bacterium]
MIDWVAKTIRSPTQRAGALILAAVLVVALAAPILGYNIATDVHPEATNLGPSAEHWLGTDHLGRDTYWRLILASRSFVGPGLLACWVASLLAIPAGALAAYRGGATEAVLRYGFTVLASLPRFVLVLLVCTIYGDDLYLLAIAVGIAYTPTLGEAIFSRIETLRSQQFVLANRAYGLSSFRILWFHLVLAACGRLIARHLLALFAYFLVLETTLSYIGNLGVQEPMPSWGNMLVFEWSSELSLNVIAPVLAIWFTVAATTWLASAFGELTND